MEASSARGKRARIGGFDDLMNDTLIPDGPANLSDLFNWPEWGLDIALGASTNGARVGQMKVLLNCEWQMYSYYAGKGTDGTIFQHLNKCFRKRGLVHDRNPFTHVHAADEDKHCLHVLSNLKDGPHKIYSHVFGAFQTRYSVGMMSEIASIKKQMDNTKESRAICYAKLMECVAKASDKNMFMKPSGTDYPTACGIFRHRASAAFSMAVVRIGDDDDDNNYDDVDDDSDDDLNVTNKDDDGVSGGGGLWRTRRGGGGMAGLRGHGPC